MNRIIVAASVLVLALAPCVCGGFILREENDVIAGTDRNYTQGLEILGAGKITRGRDYTLLRSYGLRNLMYTPTDIEFTDDRPDERPWSGLTAFLMEEWEYRKKDSWRTEWMIGAVGEWSQSDHIQAWFHRIVGASKPMGWTNQIPNEPFINVTMEYYRPLYVVGTQWKADVTAICAGSLGTAFVNGGGGLLLRGGYRVPKDYNMGLIVPTARMPVSEFSAYLFVEPRGRFVAHNITLGGSFFQDGPSRELERFVGDFRVGLAVGMDHIFRTQSNFRFSYSVVNRSREFEEQREAATYGSIMFSVTGVFQ
jgi:hypothetical protein